MPSALVGTWIGDTIRLTPRGSRSLALDIAASGRFELSVRSTGFREGQAADELSGGTREVGRLIVTDQRATFLSESLYVSSGDDQPEAAQRIAPRTTPGFGNPTLFDQAEFTVAGNGLELTYLTYPNDAPVRTTLRFVRER